MSVVSELRRASLAERRAARKESTASAFRLRADAAPAEIRAARDAAVLEHRDVADAIARRYIGRTQDADDIRQVAYIGLIKAASRFDPAKGDDFVSFAVPTISGEIKRHLRDHGWFIRPPRRIQELRGRAAAAGPRLAQFLGRSPSTRELAEYLGESVDLLREAYRSQDGLTPTSLDIPISDDEQVSLGDAIGAPDDRHARVELAADLRAAFSVLTPRERRIVHLRFFEDCTQQQIATELGVTQMQVSRLLGKILIRLRAALGDAVGDTVGDAVVDTVVAIRADDAVDLISA